MNTPKKDALYDAIIDVVRQQEGINIEQLERELALAREDAERYRWLRDQAPDKWATWADDRDQQHCDAEEIDAAIDAARNAAQAAPASGPSADIVACAKRVKHAQREGARVDWETIRLADEILRLARREP